MLRPTSPPAGLDDADPLNSSPDLSSADLSDMLLPAMDEHPADELVGFERAEEFRHLALAPPGMAAEPAEEFTGLHLPIPSPSLAPPPAPPSASPSTPPPAPPEESAESLAQESAKDPVEPSKYMHPEDIYKIQCDSEDAFHKLIQVPLFSTRGPVLCIADAYSGI